MNESKILRSVSSPVYKMALIAIVGLVSAVFAIFVLELDDYKVRLLMLLIPTMVLMLVLFPARIHLFLAIMVLGLSFSARFRPGGNEFHPGGAELSIAPMDVALIILAIPVLIYVVERPAAVLRSIEPLVWPFAIFLAAHFLSLLFAEEPLLALLEILRLLKMGLLVLIVVHYIRNHQRLKYILIVLFLVMILQGSLAVGQSLFNLYFGLDFLGEHTYWVISKDSTTIGRAGGTLGHANVLANFFEVTGPIALACVLSGIRGHFRLLALLALLAAIVGNFLTFSRAGWASMFVGLIVAVLFYGKRIGLKRIFWALAGTLMLVMTFVVVFRDVIAARLFVFWEGSKLVRLYSAITAINMIREHPIIGNGANNYLSVSSNYVGSDVPLGSADNAAGVVHNIILHYGAEIGIIGLISFFLVLLAVVRMSRKAKRLGDPLVSAVGVGALAGIVALLFHGMLDWLFRYDPVFTLFWFTVGLLAAAWNLTEESDAGTTPAAEEVV